ncbi:hypothetical protein MtrunA17_Chr8g0361741 [Medicago truncatula]|uniref:Uncharacterized protein n=1 Tax=Medicago truncatula TaxID=3880 RepID=A0A072TR89_MEDTR|nr:hypothetical protein MTR_8g467500 [Medicago truncatula]RHN41040.1 hypothetical protein MtrunA17_Chr8g0361741 [Medicago truncatula]
MAGIKKKKISSKLIQKITRRKRWYKERLNRWFTKRGQVTTLACPVAFFPGDTRSSISSFHDLSEDLVHKFESMSESVQSRNMSDQLTYLKEKGKELEAELAKINKENEETLMGHFMHQIENEGKSLDDFDNSVKNRLIAFVLEKIKMVRKFRMSFENVPLPHNNPPPSPPPMACALDNENEPDSGVTIDGKVLNQQPQLDLIKEVDYTSSGFDDNEESNTRILPHENGIDSRSDMLISEGNFKAFDNNMSIGLKMPPLENFNGGADMCLSKRNFGGLDNNTEAPPKEGEE